MTRKKFQNGKCFFVMPTQKEWIPVFRINLASLRNEKKVFEILGFFFQMYVRLLCNEKNELKCVPSFKDFPFILVQKIL
jgi:hypothetical protein